MLPGSGDWTLVGPDGSARLDVRITLCTDDDALIYAHYEGALHAPSDMMRRLRGGEPVDPGEYYFRVTPFFFAVPIGGGQTPQPPSFLCMS